MLGELVVPVLRREFAARPAGARAGRRRSIRGSRHPSAHAAPAPAQRGGRMTASAGRSLVVVSAGLSQPSSTRLLADRLSAAVGPAPSRRGRRAGDRGHRAARPRPGPDEPPADGLPEPAAAGRDRRRACGRRPDRRDADLQRARTAACSRCSSTSSSGTASPASRRSSRPPGVRPGTRWRSSTRCDRCSRT